MRWPSESAPTPREAMALQSAWRERVVRENAFPELRLVAGVDVSVRGETARAAVCVLTYPELDLVESSIATRAVEFPYVPGLLGFREVPCIVAAFGRLRVEPDVTLVDGHGLAHPRRFGVATHLGVALDRPTIGCGKSRLVGVHREPAERRGSRTRLEHEGEVIGAVVRTREGVAPLFVSIGHRVDLATAVKIVLRCTPRYRLPEPIRAAHRAAGEPP